MGPTFPLAEAVAVLWSGFKTGEHGQRLAVLKSAVQHVLELPEGADRVIAAGKQLQEAFALSVPHPDALRIRDDVAFFQAVRSQLIKLRDSGRGGPGYRDVEAAIKQLVSKSVASDRVVDIFAEAGLDKPDLTILDDSFLAHFQDMPQKNLAVEMLHRLMRDEIKTRSRSNLVLSRSFAQMLEETIAKYQSRTVEAAQIISELVKMAKEFKEAMGRGERLGLNADEAARLI